jgi:predicted O-methyltransferase YrrM
MARSDSDVVNYINKLCPLEHAVQLHIISEESEAEKTMQITRYEGQILKLLLQCIGARSVIEIGMLRGYSTIWLANAVSPLGGIVYTMEHNQQAVEQFQHIIKKHAPELVSNISCLVGNAHLLLEEFQTPVDAIFIDADKTGYPNYLKHAKRLLTPGGLLIADNVLLYGHVYGKGNKRVSREHIAAMQNFNETIAQDNAFESVILPTPEGMMVARKRSS